MDRTFDSYQAGQMLQSPSGFRSLGFFVSSGIVHVILFAMAIVIGALMPKPIIPDMTEITIIEPASSAAPSVALEQPQATAPAQESVAKLQVPKPAQEAAPQLIAPTHTAPPIAKIEKSEAPAVEDQVVVAPSKISHVKQTSPSFSAPKAAAPAPKAVAQFKGPTAADADDSAPMLETDDIENSLAADVKTETKKLDDKDIAEDLDKVDTENSAKVAALKSEMDSETNGALAEQENDLKAAKVQTDQQSENLAKHTAAMKAADQAKILQAINAEKKAAADQAAAEKAAAVLAAQQEAQAKANAAQAQAKAAADAKAQATAAKAQADADRIAAEKQAKAMALGNQLGVSGPVHGLEDIKQVPGNHRPAYDSDDRLAGRQGDVAFLAYVGKDGKVSQFKLLKSSGHRSLDAKTFAAIREWKFYPGQEGWVEIPFRWDLKGGPQEMTTTLRRNVSQK